MDLSLGVLWQRIKDNPLHLMLGGLALVLFAPDIISWIGWFFIFLGVAGTLEWLWEKTKYFRRIYLIKRNEKRIQNKIEALSNGERLALAKMREEKSETIKAEDLTSRRRSDFWKFQYENLRNLENRGLAKCEIYKNYNGKFYIFGIPGHVLEVFEKMIQKNPAFLNDDLASNKQEVE